MQFLLFVSVVSLRGADIMLAFWRFTRLEDSCKHRNIPDCEFFINKRDYPHLKVPFSSLYRHCMGSHCSNNKLMGDWVWRMVRKT